MVESLKISNKNEQHKNKEIKQPFNVHIFVHLFWRGPYAPITTQLYIDQLVWN